MNKPLQKTIKMVAIVIFSLIAFILIAIGGLNAAKFLIYKNYYSIENTLCKNPGLSDGFVCQGIAFADGKDKILVSGYMKDGNASRIYVTTLNNDSYYVKLLKLGQTFTGHLGGIAVSNETIYIASEGVIYSVKLSDVLNATNESEIEIGEGIEVNNKASFVYTDESFLYVGEFHDGGKYNVVGHENLTKEGTHYAICTKYALSDLYVPVKVYSIRNKVQGICFTPDGKVIMSTSYGLTDSVYYVYNENEATYSEKSFDGAPLYYLDSLYKKINGPAMGEDLDYYEEKNITLTESASDKYIFGKFFGAFNIVSLDFNE